MICDILLVEDDNLVISGEVAIVDFMNVTKSHLLQLDPLLVKKLSLLNLEGSPLKQNVIRMKNIHNIILIIHPSFRLREHTTGL